MTLPDFSIVTPTWVERQVAIIATIAGDDEAAHSAEDDLRTCVLEAISEGVATDPEECARLALTTADIKFERWCA